MTNQTPPDEPEELDFQLDKILLQFIAEYHQGLNELAGHGTATEQAKSALLAWRQEAMPTEHYLRAGQVTQTACSCGKTFSLASDASQHIQWQKDSNTRVAIDTSLRELLEQKVTLSEAGMTDAQGQTIIVKREAVPVSVIEAAIKKNGGNHA